MPQFIGEELESLFIWLYNDLAQEAVQACFMSSPKALGFPSVTWCLVVNVQWNNLRCLRIMVVRFF